MTKTDHFRHRTIFFRRVWIAPLKKAKIRRIVIGPFYMIILFRWQRKHFSRLSRESKPAFLFSQLVFFHVDSFSHICSIQFISRSICDSLSLSLYISLFFSMCISFSLCVSLSPFAFTLYLFPSLTHLSLSSFLFRHFLLQYNIYSFILSSAISSVIWNNCEHLQ